jgi:hypothetical protein
MEHQGGRLLRPPLFLTVADGAGGRLEIVLGTARRRVAHAAAAVFRRSAAPRQVPRGVDKRDVSERPREIAELPPGDGIVFFGEQAHVVTHWQEPREQCGCLAAAPQQA